MTKILAQGVTAPDFILNVTPDQTISLRELQGKLVILAFYPADWSPVCSDQMALYNEILPEFRKHQADLLGISVEPAGPLLSRSCGTTGSSWMRRRAVSNRQAGQTP